MSDELFGWLIATDPSPIPHFFLKKSKIHEVTGGVFTGDGVFLLTPPTETERKSLRFLSKEDEFSEKFERLVLRFTDSTYDEIKKAGTAATSGCWRTARQGAARC